MASWGHMWCFMSAVSPAGGLAPSCSVSLDFGLRVLELWLRSQGKKQPGGLPSAAPGLWRLRLGRCSPWRVCEPGGPRGGQGLRGCPAWQD